MVILRRAILLALVCVAVPVCFPDYPITAAPIIFGLYIAMMLGILFASAIISVLPFAKSNAANVFFDIVFMVIAAIILMMFLPQTDGVKAWDKVRAGQYPTKPQIYRGLSRIGIGTPSDWKEELKDNVNTAQKGIKKVEKVVVKEQNK